MTLFTRLFRRSSASRHDLERYIEREYKPAERAAALERILKEAGIK